MAQTETDVVIIGGGIVGLATAYQLIMRFPRLQITLLEKEREVGMHQTGHNSGVLHSGIYYKPGSLKAKNCRDGKVAMEQFCTDHGIEFDRCGKVIVATSDNELDSLQRIYERGQANGIRCELIDQARLAELEPHAAGIKAIHVPETGIVNYGQVCLKLAQIIQHKGATVELSSAVQQIHRSSERATVVTSRDEIRTRWIINCAGLHSDRISKLSGQDPHAKIVPFRGEYYVLKPEAYRLCKNLIYPVPNSNFPFLGVHFTRMIDGSVECGPNAVLAFAREGYRMLDINVYDLFESLTYPGFLKLAAKYWRVGAGEIWRSISKPAFVKALQRLIPEIRSDQLESAPAGVRAQAVSADGNMVDDFLILDADRIINVCNAPSPAATSSLNIGQSIVDKLAARLN
ncbi:MAG: L-2-hydroxyglutarate oxidase [Pirellulaceae bacterium]